MATRNQLEQAIRSRLRDVRSDLKELQAEETSLSKLLDTYTGRPPSRAATRARVNWKVTARRVIDLLKEKGEAMYMKDVAKELDLSHGSIANAVKKSRQLERIDHEGEAPGVRYKPSKLKPGEETDGSE